jgi:hypothetical protein
MRLPQIEPPTKDERQLAELPQAETEMKLALLVPDLSG